VKCFGKTMAEREGNRGATEGCDKIPRALRGFMRRNPEKLVFLDFDE